MNIIIVGTAYPLRGGIAHYNALLAEHLKKKHSVETITFKRQYPKLLFPGKTQEEYGTPMNVHPSPQLIDSINPLNWIAIANLIRGNKPDLIIFKYWLPFFGPCFGTIAKFAKKKTNTKVLFICDNIIPHERRIGDIQFTRYAFKYVDYFIVQSDAVERDLIRHFPDSKFRKVPHPIYENFGPPVLKERAKETLGISSKKVILYFGYVRRYKGLTILIEAMEKMRAHKDVLLIAVGEFYDDESKYHTLVRNLNLESRVRFVSHYVPNNQVANYFCASDVVMLPYLSATQSGIAQIAYNFDKPVIATNVGGLAEVIIDNVTGFVVPPNDAHALADAIIKFYDEGKEQEFSAAVRIEKTKYSWENLVHNIEELVHS